MSKSRVCIECGTPKMPQRDKCLVCKAKTITHNGEARQSICLRCKFVVVQKGGSIQCGWAGYNDPRKRHQIVDGILDASVDYFYACPDFKQHSGRSRSVSQNPLSTVEREQIRAFHEVGAFWFDPDLWTGVDPHRDDVWEKQAERLNKTNSSGVIAIATLVAAGALLLSRKKAA